MKTIKLFGFNLPAIQHDHQDPIATNDVASRKRKFSPNQEEGEVSVPPSEFHPLSVTTDDAIFGKRKLSSCNQEEEDDGDDSFIPKKTKLLRLIDDGKLATGSPNPEEEAVPPRMLTEGSSIQEADYDSSLSTKPGIFKLFGVYIYIDQKGHTVIQNPNQDDQEEEVEDQAPIQNPNQEEEDKNEVEDQVPIQNPNQEDVEQEEAPDPPEGNLVFMFEKELTSTDVARNHNRLLITKRASLKLMAALTEEERGRVEANGGDDMRVVTTDPNGVEYMLKLKRWAGSGALVLKHEWGKLVRANGLKIGDSVAGWGRRVDDEFRLSLFVVKN